MQHREYLDIRHTIAISLACWEEAARGLPEGAANVKDYLGQAEDILDLVLESYELEATPAS